MKEFDNVCNELDALIKSWEPVLKDLSGEIIIQRRNSQNRTIKQILGHTIDSISNNVHRMVHLQYQESPLIFPNYASMGNNDRWITIQNYQNEDWTLMINVWKYSLKHLIHVIKNINPEKINNEWIAGPERRIPLREMVIDFSRHMKLHLSEIEELMKKE